MTVCVKVPYQSRSRARKEARRLRKATGAKGVRPYRCDACPGIWHVGHLPLRVRAGKVSAFDVYGR